VSIDSGFVPAESVTVRDTFAVLGRRWRVLALLLVLGVVGSLLYTHEKAVRYVSHAQVQVLAVTSNEFTSAAPSIANTVSMPTEQKIATSVSLANTAAASLGTGITGPQALAHLTVTVPASTEILDFAYRASTPKAAQAGASAFEHAYLASRKATTLSLIAPQRKALTSAQAQLQKSLDSLERKLAAATNPSLSSRLTSQIGTVQAQINTNSAAITDLDTVNTAGATVPEPATLPTKPAGAAHRIVLTAGIVGGLVLGLIAAFIIDATDDHLHGPHDLADLTGAPVLARIPLLHSAKPWRRPDLAAEGPSHPNVAEAYRLLANRLVVLSTDDAISSILIASPAQGEGRSSVAANLAASFVDLGCRVWLVSADLSEPQVHRLLAPENAAGLARFVATSEPESAPAAEADSADSGAADSGAAESADADQPARGGLTLMANSDALRPAGRLLNPLALARQIRQNQQLVDLTLIDPPALLEFADAVPLLPAVDGVIVVADAGTTRRSELIELRELLTATNARVIGAVLNRDGSRLVSRRASRARRRLKGDRKLPSSARPDASTDGSPGYSVPLIGPEPTASPAPDDAEVRPASQAPARKAANGTPDSTSDIGWPEETPPTRGKARTGKATGRASS
jgi:succinoglycan biosynthesis transport protein ExoP